MPETAVSRREITLRAGSSRGVGRRDAPRLDRLHHGRGRGRSGHAVQSSIWPAGRIRQRPRARHSDFRSRIHRTRRRRGHDRNASGGRHHVRRLHHLDHGPDGQSSRQSPLHVGWKVESSDGDAHHDGRERVVPQRNTRSRCTRGIATSRD